MNVNDIDGYRVIRKINKGGLTDLYVAADPDGMQVVIRFMKESFIKDRMLRARFINGIQVLNHLHHPNIVALLAEGMMDDEPFMIIEYHENLNLRERIQKRSELIEQHPFTLARQLAAGLNYIHQRGFLHMDLKPENLLIREDGHLILVDFDLALAHFGRAQKIRDLPGTPSYIAPETILSKTLDERSEIFVFGAVVYEMLTLHKPFEKNSVVEYQRAVIDPREKPFPLAHYRKDLSTSLEKVVLKCLAKKPDDRYPSMSLVVRDLDALL